MSLINTQTSSTSFDGVALKDAFSMKLAEPKKASDEDKSSSAGEAIVGSLDSSMQLGYNNEVYQRDKAKFDKAAALIQVEIDNNTVDQFAQKDADEQAKLLDAAETILAEINHSMSISLDKARAAADSGNSNDIELYLQSAQDVKNLHSEKASTLLEQNEELIEGMIEDLEAKAEESLENNSENVEFESEESAIQQSTENLKEAQSEQINEDNVLSQATKAQVNTQATNPATSVNNTTQSSNASQSSESKKEHKRIDIKV